MLALALARRHEVRRRQPLRHLAHELLQALRLLFERALLAWPALSVHTRQRLERRAYDLTCAHHGAPEWAGVVQAARRLARIASRTLDVPHAVHTVEGR